MVNARGYSRQTPSSCKTPEFLGTRLENPWFRLYRLALRDSRGREWERSGAPGLRILGRSAAEEPSLDRVLLDRRPRVRRLLHVESPPLEVALLGSGVRGILGLELNAMLYSCTLTPPQG